jgi:hypothetical protein
MVQSETQETLTFNNSLLTYKMSYSFTVHKYK